MLSDTKPVDRNTEFPAYLRGKKVLVATESLGPVNGVSRTTLSLITHLENNGVYVAVVAPQYNNPPCIVSGKNSELRLHGYPLPYNPDLRIAYPFRLDRVYARTFTPDVVYLASPASVGFQLLLQIRQLINPPIILLNFQTDLSAYSKILFVPLVDRYAQWLLQTVQGFLFKHKAVHTIFYPCGAVRRYLEQAGAPANRMVHLGRGVDTEMFNPSHCDDAYRKQVASNGELILISVCRLAPEKGFKFLSQAASRLKTRGIAFKLLIVGGNHNIAVEEEVHRYFQGMKELVTFTGMLQGKDLSRAYASADVFVHCSITETFGLVVLESMASGVPVIARDEGGPSEIVNHGKTGYLVAPHDLDTFVGRVEELARNRNLLREMSTASRAQALATTWERINNKIAWQLANALHERSLTASGSLQHRRTQDQPVRSIVSRNEGWTKFGLTLISAFRYEAAIGLVYVFWNIAVVPILICGLLTY